MKFEQLLQVYWSKSFYFAGKMLPFNNTINGLFYQLKGLSYFSKYLFIKRFELGFDKYKKIEKRVNFALTPLDYRKIINMYLSKMTGISNSIDDLIRYNLIRLYLIKSFKGKAHSLGKPSRGQRTWSNAWTAYKISSPLKNFVNEMKKLHLLKKKPESKNKKIIKKKIKIIYTNKIKKEKKKTNLWF